jgi:hypothetical protein
MRLLQDSLSSMSQFDDDIELSLDQVDALLAIPQTRARTKEEERNVKTWFKVTHTKAAEQPCQVTLHDEASRPRNKGMTTMINDVAVCRVCYLAELDK